MHTSITHLAMCEMSYCKTMLQIRGTIALIRQHPASDGQKRGAALLYVGMFTSPPKYH